MADEAETERVTFTIANPRTVNSKSLYALVDVEVQVAGLSFGIIGVQVRHGSGGLSVSSADAPRCQRRLETRGRDAQRAAPAARERRDGIPR